MDGIRGRIGNVGEVGFAVSPNGFLIYAPGGIAGVALRTLVWVDRQGKEEPLSAPPRPYAYARLSPDGTRVALDVRDRDSDIWVWHLVRHTLTRVTANPGLDFGPVWSVDGERLIFGSTRHNTQNLAWQAADGTGSREWLAESADQQFPNAATPDGKHVLFNTNTTDLQMVSLGDGAVVPVLETPARETNGEISPNGRWLAYETTESGRAEIYVRPLADVNRRRVHVSSDGGTRPAWNRNGRELWYLTNGSSQGRVRMMATAVQIGTMFSAERARQLFEGPYFTVEMMRTNHVSPEALKTMPPGTGFGMDFEVVTDAAAAGDSVPTGTFSWWGALGTWFWIDPIKDLAFVGMVQHQDTARTRPIHGLSRSLVYQTVID